jgi:hypothetical protein
MDAQSDPVRCDVIGDVTVTSVTSETNVMTFHWMTLAGKTGQGRGEVMNIGVEVGGCGGVGAVVVACVGVGDGVAVVAFDPGEGGVA